MSYDVFISYAHIDNKVESGADEGWVSAFVRELQKWLERLTGYEGIKVWHDELLDITEPFKEQLIEELQRSKILLTILSPSFCKSRWCKWEIDEFHEGAKEKRNKFFNEVICRVENKKAPILILEIWPVDEDIRPSVFDDRIVKKFWDYHKEYEAVYPYGYPIQKEKDREYAEFLKYVGGIGLRLKKKLIELNIKIKRQDLLCPVNPQQLAEGDSEGFSPSPNHSKFDKVFINIEPVKETCTLGSKVATVMQVHGYKNLTFDKVNTENSSKVLEENILKCSAVIYGVSDLNDEYSKTWLKQQIKQLIKFGGKRGSNEQDELDFVWVVTLNPGSNTSWLNESLETFPFCKDNATKVLHINDLGALAQKFNLISP